jgi:threonine synthase
MTFFYCTSCRHPYPDSGAPYRCSQCNGVFDQDRPLPYDPGQVERQLPGIWRYRHTFPLPEGTSPVSLGEGNTPLVWAEAFGSQVAFKCEYQNPTGSFKDRGSATLVGFLGARGVRQAVEDSSGNAGASFAAYAARAGIRARVFVPDSASGPKRAQIESYGAQVVRIMGPRSNAAEAVWRAVDPGRVPIAPDPLENGGTGGDRALPVYASHAYLPFNLCGYATLAYELLEQLDGVPGAVLAPVGQGGLLLGIGRGFAALQQAGLVDKIPALIGVQARGCAPLWALFSYGPAGLSWVSEGETLAEGLRVSKPVRGDAVMQLVAESQGAFLAIDEDEILPGQAELARRGFYVEPTSAVVWGAIAQLAGRLPEPLVVVLTGSGLKSVV